MKAKVDEFFGGHLAVLGNTGSGKSCTVASILQSLFDKRDELAARGATFLLLDVNGEYRAAFAELPATIKRSHLAMRADPGAAPHAPLESFILQIRLNKMNILKSGDEIQIPIIWRKDICKIVKYLVNRDPGDISSIETNKIDLIYIDKVISDYGDCLSYIHEDSWNTSFCRWMGALGCMD